MSDIGRKDLSSKAGESLKPDSAKSGTEQLKEGITDLGDKASGTMQPSGDKSATQKMSDTVSGDSHGSGQGQSSESMLDKAKDAVGMGQNK